LVAVPSRWAIGASAMHRAISKRYAACEHLRGKEPSIMDSPCAHLWSEQCHALAPQPKRVGFSLLLVLRPRPRPRTSRLEHEAEDEDEGRARSTLSGRKDLDVSRCREARRRFFSALFEPLRLHTPGAKQGNKP
jgi:hypothetical protein